MVTLKELGQKPQRLAPGHRSCAGCGFPSIIRTVLAATDKPVIAASATGCLEVTTTIYPDTSWEIPFIHSAFENSAATISGVEAAMKALKKRGVVKDDVKLVAFGGDGGTYDIGLQSLSGTLERGHDIFYVCYDNEAYMNTGIQRSSATPLGAATTTTPAGKVIPGKQIVKKDLTKLIAAHNIPYVAQAAMHNWQDLYKKAQKGFETQGPAFMNVFSPCVPGWGYDPSQSVKISKLAVECKFWPLIEIIEGQWVLNYNPSKPIPVVDYLKTQKRFAHLFKPKPNQEMLDKIQNHVDSEWESLLKRCEEK